MTSTHQTSARGSTFNHIRAGLALALFAGGTGSAMAQQKLHFTYLWHLEQPIYWPDRQTSGADRYERAWESQLAKNAGRGNPQNDLFSIFSLADRVAVYQSRTRDSIQSILGKPEAGAQITYSGGLIENITSLGNANQWGYGPAWYGSIRQARGWTTSAGKPRADVVLFSFHHALLPLVDESTVRKEIQLYKSIYPDAWGSSPGLSRGFFPSEMAFSTRLIKPLSQEGVAWTVVSSEKISRACADFPVVLGSGGVNCDPPNRADQINPAQGAGAYYRQSISRGCSPAEAYPYAMQPRRSQYVDPETGQVYSMIVVPASQSLGWKDGYAPIGTGDFDNLQTRNDGTRPQLVVLAHDGDNAWGGGFSYYMEAVPNLVNSASGLGYTATTIEQYLNDHPIPANDSPTFVEDGAWVNADGDFGAPQMINWNWPLLSSAGAIDIPNGWHEDPRNWAVITAAQNRVDTAEQISTLQGNPINIRRVLYPETAGTTNAERAWHYFLGSLNSGYMYYGTSLDLELKPTIACNEAVRNADPVIGDASLDATPPTIWIPQRHPWNPGSTNFGPQYGYQQVGSNGDFYVWTFAYDVSGISSVTLKYRLDNDGQRSLSNSENDTYAGGAGVGAWTSLAMTKRAGGFPAGNVYNNPEINFSELPAYIADQYTTQVVGVRDKLVDYYVEAVDTKGNIKKSPIQHVYVGPGTTGGGGGGGGTAVTLAPNPPVAGQSVTITYDPAGRNLASAASVAIHYGYNNWTTVVSPDVAMTKNGSVWNVTLSVPGTATELDMVFNNGTPGNPTTWDNNGGADWKFAVQGGVAGSTWTIDGTLDADATQVAINGTRHLWAGLKGDNLYVACEPPASGNDQFIFLANAPGALKTAQWAKAGQVATWDYFLGSEVGNAFNGWFNAAGTGTTSNVQSARGSVLEGTINLRAVNGGVLPASVYLAAAPYVSPDGGALVATQQVPAGNGNGNLDAAEFARVDLCQFQPGGCVVPCFANCDGSTDVPVLTAADFSCFLTKFRAGDSGANCDGSTGLPVLTAADFSCFLTKFRAGCP